MSVKEANKNWEDRAEHIAAQLSEAIRNGDCPRCGTAIGVIHEESDGKKFRQCGYCGNRYEFTEGKVEADGHQGSL